MNRWIDDISTALANLGGIAHRSVLLTEIRRIRPGPYPRSFEMIVQRQIQNFSSDSAGFKGKSLFYTVNGIGSGVWGLVSHLNETPRASDIAEPAVPDRAKTEIYRILRDTELARKIKLLHKNLCQLCGQTITLKGEETYAEAHHIKPLGSPHNGPDIAENIVVLCPNHHVMLDYGAISVEVKDLKSVQGHVIGNAYIRYHNEHIVSRGRL